MSTREKLSPKSDKLNRIVWRTYGSAMVQEALKSEKCTLPGFALAVALAEKIVADNRAELAGTALREAAKYGADIARSTGVFTTVENNAVVLEVEYPDLADMTGDEPK
jgi:hypothetical protein